VAIRLLELVIHDDNLDLEPGLLQMAADGPEVCGQLTLESDEREDADLVGHPQQVPAFQKHDHQLPVPLG
jgi:hypothetical protein